jgi:hypothetical protein
MRQGIHKKLLLMRAAACLLAVLILVAADFVVAQKKHLIDPMHPGSLNPEPLPPLQNPDAPSTAWHKLPEAEESEYGENNNDCSDQPDDVVHALLPCRQMCSAGMAKAILTGT